MIDQDELTTYAAAPQHSVFVIPNFFYPDGSQFSFDMEPRYVLDEWQSVTVGGIYDLPPMQRLSLPYVYNGWTNWCDKFMKDYRFSSQSDTNATATLFPEVHDPWMYCEYLYEGTATPNDLTGFDNDGNLLPAEQVVIGIVEPQLVNPLHATRTFNQDNSINTSDVANVNNQPSTVVNQEVQTIYELENKWKSTVAPYTEYWQSQLEAQSWVEQLSDGTYNRSFNRLSVQRRVVKYGVPVLNSGVRMNRHPVWVRGTRWGQSQNVPQRTVDLTGPKEYFKPTGLFTGKIVPHVTIEWGIPIYDEIPNPELGTQCDIRYQDPGATAGERIFQYPVTPTGIVGKPSALFTYPIPQSPGNFTGAFEIQNMPRKNGGTTLTWNPPDYANDDLLHEGCTFWVGHNGTAFCNYYQQNQSKLNFPSYEQTVLYTDPAIALPVLTFPPFFETESQCLIYVSDHVHPEVKITDLNFTMTSHYGTEGSVTSVTVGPAGPSGIFPASSTNGFYSSPSYPVSVRTVVQSLKMPYPDPPKCAMYKGPTASGSGLSNTDPVAEYKAAGGKCSYYTPGGPRVVHSYQAVAANGADWANMQRGLPANYKKGPFETAYGQTMSQFGGMGGFVGGMAFSYALNAPSPDPYTAGLPPEDNSRVVVTYEAEVLPIGGKSTYYNTPDKKPRGQTPIQDVLIDPTTGYYTFDDEDITPFGGVDSTFYGMVNQQNFRLKHNVQHCFQSDKCTSIIQDPNGNVGFLRGRFSNINFLTHPLRVPGFAAYDGTDKYCHTGNARCPHNNLDRRAVEYNENYKFLIREILRPFRSSGISVFSGFGIQEGYLLPDGTLTLTYDLEAHPDLMCVAIRREDNGPPRIGVCPVLATDENSNKWRIFFYYDRPQDQAGHRQSHVMAHIVQFSDDDLTQYMKCPTADRTAWNTLYGNADTVPWLVELYDNYLEPSGNLIYCSNAKPFAGGRPPEYKDRSKLGSLIVCSFGGYTDDSFETGATQTNQFGGPAWNVAPTSGQIKRGYWTQLMGEWILDGRIIGYGEGFVPPADRMRNHAYVEGHKTPVDGDPSISISDPDSQNQNTGVDDSPEKPTGTDYANTGWAYSNDTKAYIRALQNGLWQAALPVDPFTGATIEIAPPSPNVTMLPRERFWFQCDKCGIDFPEEEINFLKGLSANSHGDPLYPLPSGVQAATSPIGPSGAVMGCPRYDGGAVRLVGPYVKFMTCYSRGEVDFWAPPGTTVRHDAYFWKSPVLVNRAHKDQLLQKLGAWSRTGGGVQFQNLTPQIEKMGRLPATTVKNYEVGLSRQIVAPWGAPGQSVRDVRNRWGQKLGLQAVDVSYVQRGQTQTLVTNETSFMLNMYDVLTFYRNNQDGSQDLIGIPISVCLTAPSEILNDPSVLADTPLPLRTDYPDNELGERSYQSELSKWLISCVYGTIQNFSSSPLNDPNLWSAMLHSEGINGDLAKPYDPSLPGIVDLDERIISPYTTNAADGLKMITVREMNALRNSILPMLAYDLGLDTYTGGGDFTNNAQAGYSNRFENRKKPFSFQRFGYIDPQILAATTTGGDAYVEWSKGDIEDTKARAYYPTGSTWWRMNQRIGCIKRNGGINYMHLDNSTGGAYPFAVPYTGDDIVSGCLIFLHGRLPMHMEILRAFLIYAPNDPPDFEAIGCQGQFTGNESGPSLYDGGYINNDGDEGNNYVGNLSCFWMHYHGYKTNHELDHPEPYYGLAAKNHVIIGHSNPMYFHNRGTQDNPNTPWLLSNPQDYSFVRLHEIPDIMQYQPFMAGDSNSLYLNQLNGLLTANFEDVPHGFDVPAQPWFAPWTFGEDIVQTETEDQVWKDMSYGDYSNLYQQYHSNGQAMVNGIDKVQSFEYVGSYFRDYIWPREQSAIPGWLNMSGYDSAGRFDRTLSIEPQNFDSNWASGGQVILQDSGSTGGVGATGAGNTQIDGGGNGTNQAGSVEKVMDITDTIKQIYNDRVDRYFKVTLGASYDSLYDSCEKLTDTNDAKNPQFHQQYEDPWYFWNYRYMYRVGSTHYGMWLNDPWHHPPLQSDQPIADDGEGDPIGQATQDQQARVSAISDWDKQGLTDPTDPQYMKYHALSLCVTDVPLPVTLPPYAQNFNFATPRPVDDPAGGYWRMIDDSLFTHFFEMDIRQVPYETDRRNWRDKAPSIDASDATCPNISCFIHDSGMTMGQLLANSQQPGGYGVVPSLTSPHCPNCNTILVGVRYIAGDGITTVHYEPPQLPDALINALEVYADSNSFYPGLHHGFAVEYFNSIIGQWRPLFSVNYDNTLNKFQWLEWQGRAWVTQSGNTAPTLYKGCEGANGVPKNTNINGIHFIAVTGCKVRYKVTKPIVNPRTDPVPVNTWSDCDPVGTGPTFTTNQITVAALIDTPVTKYVGRSITLQRSVTNPVTNVISTETKKVAITGVTGTTGNFTISLSGPITNDYIQYNIAWTEYISRCIRFRVYGYPFAAGQLIITPPGFLQPVVLVKGVTSVRLNNWPTQLNSVTATAGDSDPVNMTEVDYVHITATNFYWSVEQDTFAGYTYMRLINGMWAYDNIQNTVNIPNVFKHPTQKYPGTNDYFWPLWSLNQDLYSDPKSTFTLKTLPNMLLVEFFTGNGMSIDVQVRACGVGPSYQLEAECVQFIAQPGDTVPNGFTSDALPAMGQSLPFKTNNNNRVGLNWQVYNHQPLMWPNDGGGSVQWLVGDELGPRAWGRDDLFNIMTGGLGDSIDKMGLLDSSGHALNQGGALGGVVAGTCTLYGSPNTILSGNLLVYAKAITKKTYQTPAGPVTFSERTGGYRCGGFTFNLRITDPVSNGRTGLTCGVPQVLIWARARNLDSDPVPLA